MNKLLCLLLVLCTAAVFSGCSKAETSSQGDTVDVEYFAKLGKMPESDYSLGADVDKLNGDLSSAASESQDAMYNVTEGKLTTAIETGDFTYYYMNDAKDKGISYIVAYGGAYGFKQGTVIIEVQDALEKLDGTNEDADPDEIFFLPSVENCSVLKYEFEDNQLIFVFEDNALCAVAIYNSVNWTL